MAVGVVLVLTSATPPPFGWTAFGWTASTPLDRAAPGTALIYLGHRERGVWRCRYSAWRRWPPESDTDLPPADRVCDAVPGTNVEHNPEVKDEPQGFDAGRVRLERGAERQGTG